MHHPPPRSSLFFLAISARVAGAWAIAALSTACTGGGAAGAGPLATSNGSGGNGDSTVSAGSGGTRGDGGSDPSGTVSSSTSGGDGGDGGAGGDGTSTSTSSTTSTGTTSSTGTGGQAQVAEVFAHSAETLYRVDLATNTIETIGDFEDCGGDVVDIALDKDSQIFGTTYGALYRIDRTNAHCELIAEGDFPNSLSFVPAGTLDPTEEQLVGYVGANYVRIDTESGEVDTIAANVLPSGLQSSGDIVSVIDGPTLLTVKGGSCEPADCVLEIDPVLGTSIENHGSSTYSNVFGVAYWDGSLYGFTSFGEAFELVPNAGGGFSVVPIPVGDGIAFYGAGSTTAAPKGIF